MSSFEFGQESIYNGSIDIDDICQVCLEAEDSKGMFYYLIIRTLLGQSSCLEFGPLIPDLEKLPDFTTITFTRIDCEENELKYKIKNFLKNRNKGKNKIVNVREISFEEALAFGVDLIGYMKNFSDVSNY